MSIERKWMRGWGRNRCYGRISLATSKFMRFVSIGAILRSITAQKKPKHLNFRLDHWSIVKDLTNGQRKLCWEDAQIP
jgi:hypothetical protein